MLVVGFCSLASVWSKENENCDKVDGGDGDTGGGDGGGGGKGMVMVVGVAVLVMVVVMGMVEVVLMVVMAMGMEAPEVTVQVVLMVILMVEVAMVVAVMAVNVQTKGVLASGSQTLHVEPFEAHSRGHLTPRAIPPLHTGSRKAGREALRGSCSLAEVLNLQ